MRKALALSAVVCIAGGVGVSLRADTARGASLAIRRQAPLSARVVQRDGASDQMVVVSESHGVPWNTLLARTPDPSGASAPKRVGKPTSHGRSPVGLSLSVGFGNSFRALTMVPVRVTARNRTAATISGQIVVPDLASSIDVSSNYYSHGIYQAPVVLTPFETKQVTLYLPAEGLDGEVTARIISAGLTIGFAYDDPTPWKANTIAVGALTADPLSVRWLNRVAAGGGESVRVLRITPGTFDPLASVLANFDDIVVNDGTTGALTSQQLAALDQFVSNGGGLIETGGPGWQQALTPLPRDLVPGTVTGTATLPNVAGLTAVQPVKGMAGTTGQTVVSRLAHPSGAVLASERGVSLVVDQSVGAGHIIYLAFDPALNPVAGWTEAGAILTRIVLRANPAAAARGPTWGTSGQVASRFFSLPDGASSDIGGELLNVPSAALASVLLFIILASVYVLVLGPISFLVLRRFRRLELLWAVLPVGALLSMGATFGVGAATKANTVVVNTIGMVTLGGSSSVRPAQLYMGVFAPLGGNYQLTYNSPAIPMPVPDLTSSDGSGPARFRFQEGGQTGVSLPKMAMWTMRSVGLTTSVAIPGNVRYELHIDRHGRLVGWVRNSTRLNLIRPAVIAGRSFVRLPNLPPGTRAAVNVRPDINVRNNNHGAVWARLYGQYPNNGGGCCSIYANASAPGSYDSIPLPITAAGQPGASVAAGGGGNSYLPPPCCFGQGPVRETNLGMRIRDAATQIPEAQWVDSLSPVLFAAWTEQPLVSVTVNGATPDRRDLNLVVEPLSPSLEPGHFTLRTGTLGATLVDVSPARPDARICCSAGSPVLGAIEMGTGGSATYQFTLPDPGRVHFKHLSVFVNPGGTTSYTGRMWDWQSRRWMKTNLGRGVVHLTRPNRFVSPQGVILVKLLNWDRYNDLYIEDAHRYIQISGDGTVS